MFRILPLLILLLLSGCVTNRELISQDSDESVAAFDAYVTCSDAILAQLPDGGDTSTMLAFSHEKCISHWVDQEAAMVRMFLRGNRDLFKARLMAKIESDEMRAGYIASRTRLVENRKRGPSAVDTEIEATKAYDVNRRADR